MSARRFVCVHAHFYQPPRENPWLEAVEVQDSARPYHDWNERITDECYAPNGAARILDQEGRILDIVNNYSRLSFNFGPTLLAWLEDRRPSVYARVIEADRQSQELFSGHGSAIAQPYNHMIMPLATSRDKRTQIVWGIADFVRRFGRRPEGMWLPETAVDLETLDLLAEHGMRFTILSPTQAGRVRRIGGRGWRDVTGGRIDPTRAYTQRLGKGGRSIALFFYDGPISQAVAFEGLLASGERFAERLSEGFSEQRDWPQLVHIATDGETYGHHHGRGDMALAYALREIELREDVTLTNYAHFLDEHPPTHEVEIVESTAWSCVHGVDRWWTDCGCNSGRGEWRQSWRTPLRNALDFLRDALAPAYEDGTRGLLADPWRTRDDFVAVVLDRSPASRERFLSACATRTLTPDEEIRTWKWLELQRQAMLMYTSCGWFFDELSGIETVQVLQYAGRALQLARDLGVGEDVERRFLEQLADAKSNLPEQGDGARIFERYVRPAMVDLAKVGAHYAITSLFDGYGDRSHIYAYAVEREDHRLWSTGSSKLTVGRARIVSQVTKDSALFSYAALHTGDHNLHGAVRAFRGLEPFAALSDELQAAFERGDHAEVIRLIDRHFAGQTYSLKQLFRDDQRRILDQILRSTLAGAEASYRQVYERHAPLMRFLRDIGMPQPDSLLTAAHFVLDAELRDALGAPNLDLGRITALVQEARSWGVAPRIDELGYALGRKIDGLAAGLAERPGSPEFLDELRAAVGLANTLPLTADLWAAQNVYFGLRDVAAAKSSSAEGGVWLESYRGLGEALGVRPQL
ncbi:MAG TPA: DUF3536 domain-containing protein [Candidatus Limnocylindria bacterium]|nr:DUF3536 domain-containing protein [Candidatus Limnocylindria bacterium]